MKPVLFSEKQKFTQAWLWVTLILQTLIVFLILFLIPNPAIWIVVPISLLVILLLAFANLKIEVRAEGIYYQFFPFHLYWHYIALTEIKQYHLRQYEPLMEYGGWGLRYSRKHGKAYNVKGEMGMQLELNNGKKILFGTQQGEGFKKALDSIVRSGEIH